jgi:hypothetical protein
MPNLTIKPGYRAQSEDTTPESDAFTFWLLRNRSLPQRLSMAISLTRNSRRFSINCLRKQFAGLSQQAFARKLAEAWLQEHCPPHYLPSGDEMTWIQDSITLAAQLHPLFERLSIPYYVTGGVAAIAYGEPRTTQDLDVVVSIQPTVIHQLAVELEQSGFYVPGTDDVIQGRLSTLQITHIESIARADLMISGNEAFDRIQFERRQVYEIPGGTEVYIASAEDVILNKLRWGLKSQSEKQWRDVLGIFKVQQQNLDLEYLQHWATQLGLLTQFSRALVESGVEFPEAPSR